MLDAEKINDLRGSARINVKGKLAWGPLNEIIADLLPKLKESCVYRVFRTSDVKINMAFEYFAVIDMCLSVLSSV